MHTYDYLLTLTSYLFN